MTNEQATVTMLRLVVAQLPDADRQAVEEQAEQFRRTCRDGGATAQIALALVGAELAATE